MNITLKQAESVMASAKQKAVELNIHISIWIMDSGTNSVAFIRMDNAVLGSIDIAKRKAKTASLFRKNTEELGKKSQPNNSLYGIEHSNSGLITFPGGVPLKNKEGSVIGAIGVSGSSVENDYKVAIEGVLSLLT